MPPTRGVSPSEEVLGGREQVPGHVRGSRQPRWPALTGCARAEGTKVDRPCRPARMSTCEVVGGQRVLP